MYYEDKKGLAGTLYRVAEWVARLIYLNLLWILFTIMGVVVLGFFPATASTFTVARKWINKETDINIWKTFQEAYRKNFIKANIIGIVFLAIGWILQIDLRFFQTQSNSLTFLFLSYFSIFLFIIYMVIGLFLFPVFTHYKLKTLQSFRQAFFIVFLRPMDALMAAAGFVIVYYFMYVMPALIIFLGMSTLAVVIMWPTNRAFTILQIKMKEQKINI